MSTITPFPSAQGADMAAASPAPGAAFLRAMARAKASAVRAGQLAPAFHLNSLDGEAVALIDLVGRGPLVLSFYRGVWCDFCGSALQRLSEIDPEIRASGARQIAIGPSVPADQRAPLAALGFPVLADHGLKIASAYGLTATVPPEDRARHLGAGFMPDAGWRVCIPATYIIDPLGRVVMAAIDVDYRNRLDAGEILATLRAMHGRHAAFVPIRAKRARTS